MSVAEEMFGIRKQDKTGNGRPRPRPRAPDVRPPKPDGVSREVYMLTGGVTPASLVPSAPASVLQLKPSQRRAWFRKRFSNSARTDGLQLDHWVRVGEPEVAYPFAKFNKPIRMITYTDEEYTAVVDSLVPLGPTKPHSPNPELSLPLLTPSAAGSPPGGGAPPPPASVNEEGSGDPRNPGVNAKVSPLYAAPILEEGATSPRLDSIARSAPTGERSDLRVPAQSPIITRDSRELIVSPRRRIPSPQPPFWSPTGSRIEQDQQLKRKEISKDPADLDAGARAEFMSVSDERATAVLGASAETLDSRGDQHLV
jgi:hypothetical protein